ncbi:uncharacterized protein KY384_009267 [Bacidia gigantensis]|uniref:uncharacterized protein n=1 Tax=Bacidia gigantensis TaxID=2732470 RepID=UPI001D048E4F|nr:uncharacterized protein KY384_009267 [Bacidia gigantensis]KAG8525623.1 hypothetical protein KY384_009267 [Bacidia gigantensis]
MTKRILDNSAFATSNGAIDSVDIPLTSSVDVEITGREPQPLRHVESHEHPSAGFLGPTSFLDPFNEGVHSIEVLRNSSNANVRGGTQSERAPRKDSLQIQEGADVLKLLLSIPLHKEGLDGWYEKRGYLAVVPYVYQCIESIQIQTLNGSPDRLLDLSYKIALRTAKPSAFKMDQSLQDAAKSLFGGDLCWEVIGLILNTAGRGALVSDASNLDTLTYPVFSDWRQLSRTYLHASSKCVHFCSEYGHLNDLGFHLMLADGVLHSLVYGDADYMCWRKMGDVTAAISALGLHQDSEASATLPFFHREIRRRAFWEAYTMVIDLATFLGRPPLLNGKYCSIALPLDIQEEVLSYPDDKLQVALASIDENGWNNEDIITRWTWLRAYAICLRIREDILELSLGIDSDNIQGRAQAISDRQQKALREELPPKLQKKPSSWIQRKGAAYNFFLLMKFIVFECNDFILQRALVKRTQAVSSNLLQAAHTLLTTLCIVFGNRHRLGAYNVDLPTLIAEHGIPTAAVLALELLRHSSSGPHQADPNFPRLQIIKDLSVFVSDVSYIMRPAHGNYETCTQARKTLQTILDTVISGAIESGDQAVNTGLGNEEADDNGDAPINFNEQDWLNNPFDMDFWTNLEDHPLLV